MPLAVGFLIVGSFLVAMAPTSTAVAYCITKVKEPIPTDRCDGLVCLGYNGQTGWQTCVPPEIYCLNTTVCCTLGVEGGTAYYCPPPA